MSNPKISIIIPAYNIEDFIAKCLDSVLAQTYKNLEIIIIDDGSTDGTSAICDQYAKNDNRIKVIHQKNQGLSIARNNGIKKSTSELIVFIDGDDYIEKKYIECLFTGLGNNDICVCGYQTMPNSHLECPPNKTISGIDAAKESLIMQENYQIVVWNKLYKKSVLKNIQFPPHQKYEDSRTTYKILANANSVSFINEPLYNYVQHKTSIMGSSKLENRLDAKLLAATEAKTYFKNNSYLFAAAEISELLVYFAFLDNIFAKRLTKSPKPYFDWIKSNKAKLKTNQFLSTKLKIYLWLSTHFNGNLYKLFRQIKH